MRYGHGGVALNTAEDFWDKVKITDENSCWEWQEGLWHNGYGRFKWHYQSWRAHRFALVALGKLPQTFQGIVRHLCHNRKCCNPAHLTWGTHEENMQDRRLRNSEAGLPK